jgi:hypothetical protein
VKSSPLFNIRSSRAINQDGKGFTIDYVGKGEESGLTVPNRDNQQYMLDNLINMIRKMDDKTYDRFIEVVQQSNNDDLSKSIIHDTLNSPPPSYWCLPTTTCTNTEHPLLCNFVLGIIMLILSIFTFYV